MVLSFVVAYLFPFELFLFVYAFLGPLHYLTEINWLNKKNYFTTQKKDYYFHLFLLLIIALALFSPLSYFLRKYLAIFLFTAFGSSFGMIYFKKTKSKIKFTFLIIVLSFIGFYVFENNFNILFSIFLPTLIHVFLFTGIFILVGCLKDKSKSGKISLLFFIFCGLTLLFLPYYFNLSEVSEKIQTNYHSFEKLNQIVISILNQSTNSTINDVYFSNIGIQAMRFIAFAYTYHYFNWFSKTSIIQWHATSRFNLTLILLIWAFSILIYLYDYNIGLKYLYLLSLAHVILEFPLNFNSILNLKYIFRNNC